MTNIQVITDEITQEEAATLCARLDDLQEWMDDLMDAGIPRSDIYAAIVFYADVIKIAHRGTVN